MSPALRLITRKNLVVDHKILEDKLEFWPKKIAQNLEPSGRVDKILCFGVFN